MILYCHFATVLRPDLQGSFAALLDYFPADEPKSRLFLVPFLGTSFPFFVCPVLDE
jgi:hypothetical protein